MLPHGLYDASLPEIRRVFGFSVRRESLIDGLEQCLEHWGRLRVVESVIIDGSFVTAKHEPDDIDLLVVPANDRVSGPAFTRLAQELERSREEFREQFGCDPYLVDGSDTEIYRQRLSFFSTDHDGNVRGLLRVGMPL